MKKRFLAITLCGIMASSMVLPGCGSSSSSSSAASDASSASSASSEASSSDSSSKKSSGVTLSFMASQDWIYDAEMDLAAQFEEETGIKIDFQIVPSDQYFSLLMTKLNSGEGPDIFGGQSGSYDLVSQYDIEKNAVDLTNESWVANYDDFAKEQTSVNGKVYGATYFDVTTDFYMVYNKKIFEEYNLEVPTTFEEYEAVCDTLLDAGITPFYEPAKDGWHQVMWFCEIGGKYSDLDPDIVDKLNNNEVTFADTDMFLTVMEQVNDMAQKGYFGDNYLSDEYVDLPANMGSGEYAMTMGKAGSIAEIAAASDGKYTEDDFDFFLIPTLDNDVLNVHPCGASRFIYSGSEHIEEAKQYFEYITTQSSVQYMIDNEAKVENLPYNVDQTPGYSETTTNFVNSCEKQGVVFQDVIKYLNPQWSDIGADMVSMFIGEMTPEEVLQQIDARRTSQAQAAGDENWS
jgi:raffinose/stachyose/melibiose transport system substrate-binding protein